MTYQTFSNLFNCSYSPHVLHVVNNKHVSFDLKTTTLSLRYYLNKAYQHISVYLNKHSNTNYLYPCFFIHSGRRDIALSVVQKTSPVLAAPTKGRARPPAFNNIKPSSFKSEDGTYDFIPEPDYSPPSSPTTPNTPGWPAGNDSLQRDKQSSGVYKKRISTEETNGAFDRNGSGIYKTVIKEDPQAYNPSAQNNGNIQPQRPSGKYTKSIPAPGAVNVMGDFKIPKLKPVNRSVNQSFDSAPKSPVSPSSPRDDVFNNSYDNTKPSTVRQMQQNHDQVYTNQVRDKSPDKSEKPVSPRYKTRQAPPVPSAPRAVPPPPNVAPVPPPPVFGSDKAGKGKLKQVHWSRTPKPMVSCST